MGDLLQYSINRIIELETMLLLRANLPELCVQKSEEAA